MGRTVRIRHGTIYELFRNDSKQHDIIHESDGEKKPMDHIVPCRDGLRRKDYRLPFNYEQ